MAICLIFHFLYTNVLNYVIFTLTSSTCWKNKKALKRVFTEKKIKQEAQLLLGDRATRKHAKDS